MLAISKWTRDVKAGEWMPVSFFLEGRPARLIADGPARGETIPCRVEGADLRAELRIEEDAEMNLVRFGLSLRAGAGPSGRINRLRILDLRIEHADHEAGTTLRTFTGGTVKHYTASSFPPAPFRIEDTFMRGHDIARYREDTGRCSNEHLPIWLYGQAGGGVWFGPEWHGSWSLEIHRLPEYSTVLLELDPMDFCLQGGEEIRLPEMVLGVYQGDLQDGGNQVRRVIRDRYIPEIGGQKAEAKLAYQVLGAHPDWMSDPQIFDEVDQASKLGAQSFTWSSFWQFPLGFKEGGKNWWDVMGDYRAQESRFPNGIEPLARALEDRDMRLGLWVDPRVGLSAGQALEDARDVLLFFDEEQWEAEARKKYNQISYEINIQPLIDLSRPAGREFFADILERMVTRCGARWIWFDMNTDPGFCHFQTHEAPDRKGLLELRWFQGLDAVMTAFVEKHPDVWIEWCASGGRMISLAACRYSHSHWITDYVGPDPDIASSIRAGANSILPAVCNHQSFYLAQEQNQNDKPISDEAAISHFAGHFGLSQGLIHYPQKDLDVLKKMGEIWKEHVRPMLCGDFYLLSDQARSREDWEVWQAHRPDLEEGVVCVMRLSRSLQSSRTLRLRGLDSGRDLQWELVAGQGQFQAEGLDLTVSFDSSRVVVLRYRAKESA